jgi:hypothetical protein
MVSEEIFDQLMMIDDQALSDAVRYVHSDSDSVSKGATDLWSRQLDLAIGVCGKSLDSVAVQDKVDALLGLGSGSFQTRVLFCSSQVIGGHSVYAKAQRVVLQKEQQACSLSVMPFQSEEQLLRLIANVLRTHALPKYTERNRIKEFKGPVVYDALKLSLATLSGISKDRHEVLEGLLRARCLSNMASASASQLQQTSCATGHQARKIHTFFNQASNVE